MKSFETLYWLPAIVLLGSLAIAAQIKPSPSTIELLYLRPIDLRTKALILSTALCGPVVGWTVAIQFMQGPSGRRIYVWLACGLAMILSLMTLRMAGVKFQTSVALGIMSGLQATTATLLITLYIRRAFHAALALILCGSVAMVALIAIFTNSFSLIGILVPTYWMGDILVAEQLAQENRSAAIVGISLHLLPLTIALGLTVMHRETEAQAALKRDKPL